MVKDYRAKTMGVCTGCGGASRAQYSKMSGHDVRTSLREFSHKTEDKLKGVGFDVRISNYNG